MKFAAAALVVLMALGQTHGQVPSAPGLQLETIAPFKLQESGLALRRHVEAGKPFTVAGMNGVILGQQDGTFEAWILPVKLLSHFTIRAEMEGYSVPIELNPAAAAIEVFPDHTTITYAHIGFNVKQIMFAPDGDAGAVVLFQFDAVRALNLTFSFTPEVRRMWPEANEGVPAPEWVKRGNGGFYLLHLDFPDIAAAIAMPHTQSGILAPYQEKPQVHPLELKLHYDPKADGARYFPLLMAVGTTKETATNAALEARLVSLQSRLPQVYREHADRYAALLNESTAIETPDRDFNDYLRWAEISIEQLKAKAQPTDEIGLVAGYYSSGDSARPGFGWFFGRDTLYTLYAINGYGDFKLSREALEFLIARQRDDGKVMHEYSQTAAFTDWKSLPYMYAAADATPLYLTATWDYVRASGDVKFLKAHRASIEKAWQFETTHDSDGDGIYDNTNGTGWVESWPTGMPHQEVYLALLDQQASVAAAELFGVLGDAASASAAKQRGDDLAKKIEAEYYEPGSQKYAFSRNADGSLDHTSTVFPAVAWWNGGPGLAHPEASLDAWASHDFATDWGLRDVAASEPIYDPTSYHQGSVWPLFTGWSALAEYRAGRPLAGYTNLMQNADLTTEQDLGAVTELLSGDFFQPFGRSTSHQLWSSAMVVIPALRGLFGIEVNALAHVVTVDPHIPAEWNSAAVRHLHVGDGVCDLEYTRVANGLRVRLIQTAGERLNLKAASSSARTEGTSVTIPLPPVEVGVPHGLPLPGSRTAQLKVIREAADAHSLKLQLEAVGGTVVRLPLRRNSTKLNVTADGGQIEKASSVLDALVVRFADRTGYQSQTVTLRW
jgi:glycogen debranching enzyme